RVPWHQDRPRLDVAARVHQLQVREVAWAAAWTASNDGGVGGARGGELIDRVGGLGGVGVGPFARGGNAGQGEAGGEREVSDELAPAATLARFAALAAQGKGEVRNSRRRCDG